MTRGWVALSLLFVGCPYEDIGAIDDAHAAKVQQEQSHYALEKRYASCDDAPSGATCGLLIDQINLDEYKTRACEIPSDAPMTEDCMKQFMPAFYKELRARYPLADWQRVEAYCKGGKDRCDSLRNVERSLLLTHNGNAERDHEASLQNIDKQRTSARQDAEDQNFLVLAAMGVYVVKTGP